MDLASARDFGGANRVLQFEREMGKEARVWNPDKVAYTFDLQAPAHSEKAANNQKIIRDFAKRQGIKNVFDVNHGVGQHVMLEAALIKPGDIVLGTDSHMNLLGGVGAFAIGVGNSDIAAAYVKGTAWSQIRRKGIRRANKTIQHSQDCAPTETAPPHSTRARLPRIGAR